MVNLGFVQEAGHRLLLQRETVLIYCYIAYASCGREFSFQNYLDLSSIATTAILVHVKNVNNKKISVSVAGFDLGISFFFFLKGIWV